MTEKILRWGPSKITEIERNGPAQYWLLFVITLLAAALRFYKLGEWGLWLDEVFSLNRVQGLPAQPSGITEMLIGVTVNALGPSVWIARLIPAMIGVVTIPILYFPVRRLFGPIVALVSGLLLALSPWHLYWSQNVRFYTLLMLLYTLAMLILFIGLERDRFWYVLISMFLLFLAAWERLFAFFYFPVVLVYLILLKILHFEAPRGLRTRNLLLLPLPVILYGLMDRPKLVGVGSAPLLQQTTDSFSSTTEGFVASFIGNPVAGPLWLQANLVDLIGLPLVCLALFGSVYLLLAHKRRQDLFVVLGALIPFSAIFMLAPFVFTNERYAFIALPCWIILAAVAVKELFFRTRGPAKILAVGVLAILLATSMVRDGLYYKYQNGNRHDWEGAFTLVKERKAEDDLVATSYPVMGMYFLGQEVLHADNIGPDFVIQSGQRIWYVEGRWGYPGEGWLAENSELIDVRDVRLPFRILVMRVYLYTPDELHGSNAPK